MTRCTACVGYVIGTLALCSMHGHACACACDDARARAISCKVLGLAWGYLSPEE